MSLVFRGLVVLGVIALQGGPLGSAAWAKSEGIASTDCRGCHEATKDAVVKIVPSTTMPAFDQTVRLSVSIESPIAKRGGLYLEAMSIASPAALVGQYKLVAGQGTKLIEMGVTHDGVPKTAINGKVTFDIDWIAPKTKSSVVITVNAIGGNNAEKEHGDAFGRARGIANKKGDCNDNDKLTSPSAKELCNSLDDNCDG